MWVHTYLLLYGTSLSNQIVSSCLTDIEIAHTTNIFSSKTTTHVSYIFYKLKYLMKPFWNVVNIMQKVEWMIIKNICNFYFHIP